MDDQEQTTLLAWHFVGDTLRDGRPVPADGETLIHTGPLFLCESGLHASIRLLDALEYAPSATLCRVRCDGKIIQDQDKLVCTKRTILWRIDATDILREFARWCALQVIDFWNAPPIVSQYLETGDLTFRVAARDAAMASANAAAWDARAAAWAAARDAAPGGERAAADAALAPTVATLQASAHELYLAMINAELREIAAPATVQE